METNTIFNWMDSLYYWEIYPIFTTNPVLIDLVYYLEFIITTSTEMYNTKKFWKIGNYMEFAWNISRFLMIVWKMHLTLGSAHDTIELV